MNIGVDMDSVIAEIIVPIDLFHNRKYKTNLSYNDHSVYDLRSIWQCNDEQVYERIFEFYHSPEFTKVKPIDGSQEAVKKLAKLHNLHLITSRPHDIEQKTKQWLNAFFPHQFVSVTHTNQVSKNKKEMSVKKSVIAKQLKIELMIDDHLTYALDCANNEINTLLFEAPWNKTYIPQHKFLTKVAGWSEILNRLF